MSNSVTSETCCVCLESYTNPVILTNDNKIGCHLICYGCAAQLSRGFTQCERPYITCPQCRSRSYYLWPVSFGVIAMLISIPVFSTTGFIGIKCTDGYQELSNANVILSRYPFISNLNAAGANMVNLAGPGSTNWTQGPSVSTGEFLTASPGSGFSQTSGVNIEEMEVPMQSVDAPPNSPVFFNEPMDYDSLPHY